MIFDPSKETRPEVLAAEEEYFGCKPCFEKGRNRHIFQSGFNAGAASRDAEIARLKTVPMRYRRMAFNAQLQNEVAELVAALERMRVAGGSQEFHIAWELAKDVLTKVRKP